MTNFIFGRDQRLLNAHDYQTVFDGSQWKVSSKEFLFIACANKLPNSRLGLVIAKKHVRLAVHRNRIKRLIRESFRVDQATLNGIDVVVLARAGSGLLDNVAAMQQLTDLWRRLHRRSQNKSQQTHRS